MCPRIGGSRKRASSRRAHPKSQMRACESEIERAWGAKELTQGLRDNSRSSALLGPFKGTTDLEQLAYPDNHVAAKQLFLYVRR